MTHPSAIAEREAIVAWIADKAAEWERAVKQTDKLLDPLGRKKATTTGVAFRFIQHAIERGDHIKQEKV